MTDVPTEGKNLADSVDVYGRGRELFRPPTYSLSSVSGFHVMSLLLMFSDQILVWHSYFP